MVGIITNSGRRGRQNCCHHSRLVTGLQHCLQGLPGAKGLVLMQGWELGEVNRLAQTKVRQLHMSIHTQQQVVRLDVSAANAKQLCFLPCAHIKMFGLAWQSVWV